MFLKIKTFDDGFFETKEYAFERSPKKKPLKNHSLDFLYFSDNIETYYASKKTGFILNKEKLRLPKTVISPFFEKCQRCLGTSYPAQYFP